MKRKQILQVQEGLRRMWVDISSYTCLGLNPPFASIPAD